MTGIHKRILFQLKEAEPQISGERILVLHHTLKRKGLCEIQAACLVTLQREVDGRALSQVLGCGCIRNEKELLPVGDESRD